LTALIVVAGGVALSLYPESWRTGLFGAIGTALFGTVWLFGETWALFRLTLPESSVDLVARNGAVLGRLASRVSVRSIACAVALLAGLSIATVQAIGEGLPSQATRALVVLAVFVGLESAGVALGFALFARPLGVVP
jgi:hypothetical protein